MALNAQYLTMILALLAIFGTSTALGGRKMLAIGVDAGAIQVPVNGKDPKMLAIGVDAGAIQVPVNGKDRKMLAIGVDAGAIQIHHDSGFVPVNGKDPKIMELGKSVVDKYNKDHKQNVQFDAILEAMLYSKLPPWKTGLVILTTGNDGPKTLYADVMVDQNSKTVVNFKENI